MSTKKRALYLLSFVVVGIILLRIPFSQLIGSEQTFSLFDFFAPAVGAMLTSIWGAIAVIGVKLINTITTGQEFDTVTIIRLFPLALAALYFGARKYKYVVALIPIVCMALFIMHPEGRQAWYYSLYWLIPVAVAFAKRGVVLNAIGATFTGHAIGGAAFLYAFNLPAEVWIALIPIVFIERMMFAGGIAVSYVTMNSLVHWLAKKLKRPSLERLVHPEHIFSWKLLKHL